MRYSLHIEYDGTSFAGWQIQKDQVTIQDEIEKAIEVILRQKTTITGAGRTDSGVHARGQLAHFDFSNSLDILQFQRSLNGLLPGEIRIQNCERVSDNFHARFSAKERKYCYYIATKPSALLRHYSWYISYNLNLKNMQNAVRLILGKHNFKSFCRTKSDVSHHLCDIKKAEWTINDSFLIFEIRADRFLHGMVRALVGTFVDIGCDKVAEDDFKNIMIAEDRRLASQAAPAKGLVLERVYY